MRSKVKVTSREEITRNFTREFLLEEKRRCEIDRYISDFRILIHKKPHENHNYINRLLQDYTSMFLSHERISTNKSNEDDMKYQLRKQLTSRLKESPKKRYVKSKLSSNNNENSEHQSYLVLKAKTQDFLKKLIEYEELEQIANEIFIRHFEKDIQTRKIHKNIQNAPKQVPQDEYVLKLKTEQVPDEIPYKKYYRNVYVVNSSTDSNPANLVPLKSVAANENFSNGKFATSELQNYDYIRNETVKFLKNNREHNDAEQKILSEQYRNNVYIKKYVDSLTSSDRKKKETPSPKKGIFSKIKNMIGFSPENSPKFYKNVEDENQAIIGEMKQFLRHEKKFGNSEFEAYNLFYIKHGEFQNPLIEKIKNIAYDGVHNIKVDNNLQNTSSENKKKFKIKNLVVSKNSKINVSEPSPEKVEFDNFNIVKCSSTEVTPKFTENAEKLEFMFDEIRSPKDEKKVEILTSSPNIQSESQFEKTCNVNKLNGNKKESNQEDYKLLKEKTREFLHQQKMYEDKQKTFYRQFLDAHPVPSIRENVKKESLLSKIKHLFKFGKSVKSKEKAFYFRELTSEFLKNEQYYNDSEKRAFIIFLQKNPVGLVEPKRLDELRSSQIKDKRSENDESLKCPEKVSRPVISPSTLHQRSRSEDLLMFKQKTKSLDTMNKKSPTGHRSISDRLKRMVGIGNRSRTKSRENILRFTDPVQFFLDHERLNYDIDPEVSNMYKRSVSLMNRPSGTGTIKTKTRRFLSTENILYHDQNDEVTSKPPSGRRRKERRSNTTEDKRRSRTLSPAQRLVAKFKNIVSRDSKKRDRAKENWEYLKNETHKFVLDHKRFNDQQKEEAFKYNSPPAHKSTENPQTEKFIPEKKQAFTEIEMHPETDKVSKSLVHYEEVKLKLDKRNQTTVDMKDKKKKSPIEVQTHQTKPPLELDRKPIEVSLKTNQSEGSSEGKNIFDNSEFIRSQTRIFLHDIKKYHDIGKEPSTADKTLIFVNNKSRPLPSNNQTPEPKVSARKISAKVEVSHPIAETKSKPLTTKRIFTSVPPDLLKTQTSEKRTRIENVHNESTARTMHDQISPSIKTESKIVQKTTVTSHRVVSEIVQKTISRASSKEDQLKEEVTELRNVAKNINTEIDRQESRFAQELSEKELLKLNEMQKISTENIIENDISSPTLFQDKSKQIHREHSLEVLKQKTEEFLEKQIHEVDSKKTNRNKAVGHSPISKSQKKNFVDHKNEVMKQNNSIEEKKDFLKLKQDTTSFLTDHKNYHENERNDFQIHKKKYEGKFSSKQAAKLNSPKSQSPETLTENSQKKSLFSKLRSMVTGHSNSELDTEYEITKKHNLDFLNSLKEYSDNEHKAFQEFQVYVTESPKVVPQTQIQSSEAYEMKMQQTEAFLKDHQSFNHQQRHELNNFLKADGEAEKFNRTKKNNEIMSTREGIPATQKTTSITQVPPEVETSKRGTFSKIKSVVTGSSQEPLSKKTDPLLKEETREFLSNLRAYDDSIVQNSSHIHVVWLNEQRPIIKNDKARVLSTPKSTSVSSDDEQNYKLYLLTKQQTESFLKNHKNFNNEQRKELNDFLKRAGKPEEEFWLSPPTIKEKQNLISKVKHLLSPHQSKKSIIIHSDNKKEDLLLRNQTNEFLRKHQYLIHREEIEFKQVPISNEEIVRPQQTNSGELTTGIIKNNKKESSAKDEKTKIGTFNKIKSFITGSSKQSTPNENDEMLRKQTLDFLTNSRKYDDKEKEAFSKRKIVWLNELKTGPLETVRTKQNFSMDASDAKYDPQIFSQTLQQTNSFLKDHQDYHDKQRSEDNNFLGKVGKPEKEIWLACRNNNRDNNNIITKVKKLLSPHETKRGDDERAKDLKLRDQTYEFLRRHQYLIHKDETEFNKVPNSMKNIVKEEKVIPKNITSGKQCFTRIASDVVAQSEKIEKPRKGAFSKLKSFMSGSPKHSPPADSDHLLRIQTQEFLQNLKNYNDIEKQTSHNSKILWLSEEEIITKHNIENFQSNKTFTARSDNSNTEVFLFMKQQTDSFLKEHQDYHNKQRNEDNIFLKRIGKAEKEIWLASRGTKRPNIMSKVKSLFSSPQSDKNEMNNENAKFLRNQTSEFLKKHQYLIHKDEIKFDQIPNNHSSIIKEDAIDPNVTAKQQMIQYSSAQTNTQSEDDHPSTTTTIVEENMNHPMNKSPKEKSSKELSSPTAGKTKKSTFSKIKSFMSGAPKPPSHVENNELLKRQTLEFLNNLRQYNDQEKLSLSKCKVIWLNQQGNPSRINVESPETQPRSPNTDRDRESNNKLFLLQKQQTGNFLKDHKDYHNKQRSEDNDFLKRAGKPEKEFWLSSAKMKEKKNFITKVKKLLSPQQIKRPVPSNENEENLILRDQTSEFLRKQQYLIHKDEIRFDKMPHYHSSIVKEDIIIPEVSTEERRLQYSSANPIQQIDGDYKKAPSSTTSTVEEEIIHPKNISSKNSEKSSKDQSLPNDGKIRKSTFSKIKSFMSGASKNPSSAESNELLKKQTFEFLNNLRQYDDEEKLALSKCKVIWLNRQENPSSSNIKDLNTQPHYPNTDKERVGDNKIFLLQMQQTDNFLKDHKDYHNKQRTEDNNFFRRAGKPEKEIWLSSAEMKEKKNIITKFKKLLSPQQIKRPVMSNEKANNLILRDNTEEFLRKHQYFIHKDEMEFNKLSISDENIVKVEKMIPERTVAVTKTAASIKNPSEMPPEKNKRTKKGTFSKEKSFINGSEKQLPPDEFNELTKSQTRQFLRNLKEYDNLQKEASTSRKIIWLNEKKISPKENVNISSAQKTVLGSPAENNNERFLLIRLQTDTFLKEHKDYHNKLRTEDNEYFRKIRKPEVHIWVDSGNPKARNNLISRVKHLLSPHQSKKAGVINDDAKNLLIRGQTAEFLEKHQYLIHKDEIELSENLNANIMEDKVVPNKVKSEVQTTPHEPGSGNEPSENALSKPKSVWLVERDISPKKNAESYGTQKSSSSNTSDKINDHQNFLITVNQTNLFLQNHKDYHNNLRNKDNNFLKKTGKPEEELWLASKNIEEKKNIITKVKKLFSPYQSKKVSTSDEIEENILRRNQTDEFLRKNQYLIYREETDMQEHLVSDQSVIEEKAVVPKKNSSEQHSSTQKINSENNSTMGDDKTKKGTFSRIKSYMKGGPKQLSQSESNKLLKHQTLEFLNDLKQYEDGQKEDSSKFRKISLNGQKVVAKVVPTQDNIIGGSKPIVNEHNRKIFLMSKLQTEAFLKNHKEYHNAQRNEDNDFLRKAGKPEHEIWLSSKNLSKQKNIITRVKNLLSSPRSKKTVPLNEKDNNKILRDLSEEFLRKHQYLIHNDEVNFRKISVDAEENTEDPVNISGELSELKKASEICTDVPVKDVKSKKRTYSKIKSFVTGNTKHFSTKDHDDLLKRQTFDFLNNLQEYSNKETETMSNYKIDWLGEKKIPLEIKESFEYGVNVMINPTDIEKERNKQCLFMMQQTNLFLKDHQDYHDKQRVEDNDFFKKYSVLKREIVSNPKTKPEGKNIITKVKKLFSSPKVASENAQFYDVIDSGNEKTESVKEQTEQLLKNLKQYNDAEKSGLHDFLLLSQKKQPLAPKKKVTFVEKQNSVKQEEPSENDGVIEKYQILMQQTEEFLNDHQYYHEKQWQEYKQFLLSEIKNKKIVPKRKSQQNPVLSKVKSLFSSSSSPTQITSEEKVDQILLRDQSREFLRNNQYLIHKEEILIQESKPVPPPRKSESVLRKNEIPHSVEKTKLHSVSQENNVNQVEHRDQKPKPVPRKSESANRTSIAPTTCKLERVEGKIKSDEDSILIKENLLLFLNDHQSYHDRERNEFINFATEQIQHPKERMKKSPTKEPKSKSTIMSKLRSFVGGSQEYVNPEEKSNSEKGLLKKQTTEFLISQKCYNDLEGEASRKFFAKTIERKRELSTNGDHSNQLKDSTAFSSDRKHSENKSPKEISNKNQNKEPQNSSIREKNFKKEIASNLKSDSKLTKPIENNDNEIFVNSALSKKHSQEFLDSQRYYTDSGNALWNQYVKFKPEAAVIKKNYSQNKSEKSKKNDDLRSSTHSQKRKPSSQVESERIDHEVTLFKTKMFLEDHKKYHDNQHDEFLKYVPRIPPRTKVIRDQPSTKEKKESVLTKIKALLPSGNKNRLYDVQKAEHCIRNEDKLPKKSEDIIVTKNTKLLDTPAPVDKSHTILKEQTDFFLRDHQDYHDRERSDHIKYFGNFDEAKCKLDKIGTFPTKENNIRKTMISKLKSLVGNDPVKKIESNKDNKLLKNQTHDFLEEHKRYSQLEKAAEDQFIESKGTFIITELDSSPKSNRRIKVRKLPPSPQTETKTIESFTKQKNIATAPQNTKSQNYSKASEQGKNSTTDGRFLNTSLKTEELQVTPEGKLNFVSTKMENEKLQRNSNIDGASDKKRSSNLGGTDIQYVKAFSSEVKPFRKLSYSDIQSTPEEERKKYAKEKIQTQEFLLNQKEFANIDLHLDTQRQKNISKPPKAGEFRNKSLELYPSRNMEIENFPEKENITTKRSKIQPSAPSLEQCEQLSEDEKKTIESSVIHRVVSPMSPTKTIFREIRTRENSPDRRIYILSEGYTITKDAAGNTINKDIIGKSVESASEMVDPTRKTVKETQKKELLVDKSNNVMNSNRKSSMKSSIQDNVPTVHFINELSEVSVSACNPMPLKPLNFQEEIVCEFKQVETAKIVDDNLDCFLDRERNHDVTDGTVTYKGEATGSNYTRKNEYAPNQRMPQDELEAGRQQIKRRTYEEKENEPFSEITETRIKHNGDTTQRYTTSCYFHQVPTPVWYTESLLVDLEEKTQKIKEKVYYDNKYRANNWSETYITDVVSKAGMFLSETVIPVRNTGDKIHHISLEPQQKEKDPTGKLEKL